MCSERNPHKRHLPTVQVSSYGYRSGGQFSVLNIKTCRKCDTRLRSEIDTTIKAYRLRHISLIAGSTIVRVGYSITYDIVKSNIPRYREVVVRTRHIVPSQCWIHQTIWVGEWIEVLRWYGVNVVCRRLRLILSRLEGVTKTPTRTCNQAKFSPLCPSLASIDPECIGTPTIWCHIVWVERK